MALALKPTISAIGSDRLCPIGMMRPFVARDTAPEVALGVAQTFTRSMPEIARCNTIEVGEAVVALARKSRLATRSSRALIGAICDRDRQRFVVKSFDIVAG